MNTCDRDLIESNVEQLSSLIDLESIIPLVLNKNIFNQSMIDDILKINPESERKKCFLHDLTRRGPEAFEEFVEILFGTNHMEAGRLLRPETFGTDLRQEEVIENIISNSPPDAGGGHPSRNGHTISSLPNDNLMLKVIPCKEAMVGPNYYKMTAGPRGFCLIINNVDFDNDVFPKRKGSDTESFRFRDVFLQLHFNVELKKNLNKHEMLSLFKEYSTKKELRDHDCLVLIVLSHGHSGYVLGVDGFSIQFEEIIKLFNNQNCPLLTNKPKIFIFNCCRGDNRDSGQKLSNEEIDSNAVADAAKISEKLIQVPLASDMLICYSTVDGFVSWRNEETGSWFGTAFCNALMKHSHDKEFHHILITTANSVNKKATADGEKQVMETVYRGFKKLLYFNPGVVPNSPNS